MRAGPFSNAQIIATLNRFFIPVFVSNEDHRDNGVAPPNERAQYRRVFKEFSDGRLGTGDVHVYILKPDGHALNELEEYARDVHDTELTTENLAEFVETDIRDHGEPIDLFLEIVQGPLRPPRKRRLFGLLPGPPSELPVGQWLWTSVDSVHSEDCWIVLDGTCCAISGATP